MKLLHSIFAMALSGIAALWLSGAASASAAGLKVGPAGFVVQNVAPGRQYDVYKETGVRLTVYNDADATRSYVLSVHRPSERGAWETGYLEIPDASWCWFENQELTVGPHSQSHDGLTLKVPEEDKYYNQHWVATLGVTGKPAAGGIALAVDVRVQIETAAKREGTEKPDGTIGFRPSLIRFAPAHPGETTATQILVYNNDGKAHTYTVAPMGLDDPARASRYLTASFEHYPDSRYLEYGREMVIEAGKSAKLSLKLNLPRDDRSWGKKWEEILLVKPEDGLPGFLRCQIETQKEP